MTPRTSEKLRLCRVGLIGDHPWARSLMDAVQRRGGKLCACAGPDELIAWAVRWNPNLTVSRDPNEVLSHPEADVILLADALPFRGDLLLQAVQLDRAVLVLHPADVLVERYYMVQLALEERRFPVWPLIPHRFLETWWQMRQWLQHVGTQASWLLEANILLGGKTNLAPTIGQMDSNGFLLEVHPLWYWTDWLRLLGGEIAEVYAIAEGSDLGQPDLAMMLTGRWEIGGHFVVRFAQDISEGFCLQTPTGRISWEGALVRPGKHALTWSSSEGCETCEDSGQSVWDACAEWLLQGSAPGRLPAQWSDAVAVAELVQAVQDSLRSRNAVSLLHQEYTESAVFKSRAATLGCGLVWMILVLAMISPLVPQVLYAIPVLLVICLALFMAGWLALRR